MPFFFNIRLEFILFGLTLAGIALFHRHTMVIAITGFIFVLLLKFFFDSHFLVSSHFLGNEQQEGEWKTLLNLAGLLFGFAILAKQFEESNLPKKIPHFLPHDWKGPFLLLVMIFVLSSFLDNIAAAMIGGAIAFVVFRKKVHIGYLAAIVAASNAGGAGSVLGDTTTTLMWIDGVNPMDVLHGYIASFTALLIFGFIASVQQDKYHPILKDAPKHLKIDFNKIWIVALILAGAIVANYTFDFPALGVWVAILAGSFFNKTPWGELKKAVQGSIFLLSLVACASMMPVEELPKASWFSTFILGFVSAVFDNIPLTKLCLDQGGYDWGMLAYAVGFGGSMIWFGSSAGVALSNEYPELRSVGKYLKYGWHVILAYIIGFMVLLYVLGWQPHPPHKTESSKDFQLKTLPVK